MVSKESIPDSILEQAQSLYHGLLQSKEIDQSKQTQLLYHWYIIYKIGEKGSAIGLHEFRSPI